MCAYKQEYVDYLEKRQRQLNILKTTCTPSGQTIDWIPIESQGKVHSPPPALRPHEKDCSRPAKFPKSELQQDGVEKGPEGTVPVLRPDFSKADFTVPLKNFWVKRPIPFKEDQEEKMKEGGIVVRDATGAETPNPHWYAGTQQIVKETYGCQGTFSAFSPQVDHPNDFSLIQLSMARSQGGQRPNRNPRPTDQYPTPNMQTLEAGWHKYPWIHSGDTRMFLFTYFTTVGYTAEADNVGGYNEVHAGWQQHDRDVHPGSTFREFSVDSGDQYKLWMVYQLWRGNWWFWFNDRWLGYYPASIFIGNSNLPTAQDTSVTLGDHGDSISFFGEVADSVDVDKSSNPTTTDMGSGEFAYTHWTHSAYIHNILIQTDVSKEPDGHNDSNTDYNGYRIDKNYDPTRYTVEEHCKEGGSWGSYIWLGGPGYSP